MNKINKFEEFKCLLKEDPDITDYKAADKLGISLPTLRNYYKAIGIKRIVISTYDTPENVELLRNNQDKTKSQQLELLGLKNYNTLYNLRKKYGFKCAPTPKRPNKMVTGTRHKTHYDLMPDGPGRRLYYDIGTDDRLQLCFRKWVKTETKEFLDYVR